MAIWPIRAGSHGEHEIKFGTGNRVDVTWDRHLLPIVPRPELSWSG